MSARIFYYLPQLARRLKSERAGKKVVFTNGCFDILHRGHVEYLNKAKLCGDILVLGLNSDDSVRRLKGPARPVATLADRAAILSALRMIDYIIPFSEDTPLKLIQAIRPDVLVKGADWSEKDIVGADVARSYGGKVVRVQLTPGRSTSSIIEKVRAVPQVYPMRARLPQPTLIVIPARYGSTRFPGKALATLDGKPIVQHVYERACQAALPDWKVVVATDDRRILKAAHGFGATAVMTSRTCKSGSDRCAETAQYFPAYPVVVNLQGDEPFQPSFNIRLAVRTLLSSACPVSTLAARCPVKDLQNPNVAKVAISKGRAIYFSRSPVPFYRDTQRSKAAKWFKHIGLYVFRRSFLVEFSKWRETPLEQAEKLEQLRILENGQSIAIAVTPHDSIGIDTPADLARARRMAQAERREVMELT